MIIILDNGHGVDTQGKRSPDGRLLEYQWSREMTQRIGDELTRKGLIVELLVPEVYDVPLRVRCQRANELCKSKYPNETSLLLSIHCNASQNYNQWGDARGWGVYIAPNASTKSQWLAKCLYSEAKTRHLLGNRSFNKEGYIIQNLAICRDTICPAVLTENLFMDNQKDCTFLLSEEGKRTLTTLHVDGIEKYIQLMKG